jgi:DNA sulfur modification protein DndC
LVRELLEVERGYRTASRRAKLFDKLEDAFKRGFYEDAEDAAQRALRRRSLDGLLDTVVTGSDYKDATSALKRELGGGAKERKRRTGA